MNGNTKRKLKKEYIPLLIAVLVLIVLVLVLVIVLFYKDNKGLIVPDIPDKVAIDAGVFDFESGKYDKDNLDVNDTKKVSVDYKVITDYYKEGILISNPTVKYVDDEFIVKSGIYANDPFVSVVNKKGELEWLSKISVSGYESLKIIDVIKYNGKYNVFAVGINKNKNDNIVIKLNSKGNEEKREVLSKESDNSISSVLGTDKGFVVMTDGKDNLEVYYISDDYKMLKNPFYLRDSKENRFKTYSPEIVSSVVKDEVVTILVSYVGASNDTNYLLKYDLNKGTFRIDSFLELNKISSPYSNAVKSFEDNFYTVHNNVVYLLSSSGELVTKYDYNSVKLGKVDGCVISDDVSDCSDDISINNIHISDNKELIVYGITSSENMIVDVFDNNLKLKKRMVHSGNIHDSDENIYISSFDIDGKMYEFYSFGVDTPSILVSIIG